MDMNIPDVTPPVTPRKSRKGRYTIGLTVTALCVTAGLLVGVVGGNSEAASDNTTTTTTTTTTETDTTETDLDNNDDVVTDLQAAILNGGPEDATDLTGVTTYIDATVQHLNTIWQNWFTANGYTPPEVAYRIVQPGEEFVSACTEADGTPTVVTSTWDNAMYCPIDVEVIDGVTYTGEVILPVETMADMWSGDILGRDTPAAASDFSAAVVVAHEFGHHIADELFAQLGIADPAMPNSELLADCFAGVWADSMWKDGLIVDGNVEAALAALEALGDNASPTGHGTPEQRNNAFLTGYVGFEEGAQDDGFPSTCVDTYGS